MLVYQRVHFQNFRLCHWCSQSWTPALWPYFFANSSAMPKAWQHTTSAAYVVDIPQHTADLRQKDVSLSNVLPRKHLSQEWPQGNLEENTAQLMPPRSPTFSMPCRCIVSRESVAKKWRVLLFCMWNLPGRVICHS